MDGTNKWKHIDMQIKDYFETQGKLVNVSDTLKWKIDEQIRLSKQGERKSMKKWSIKRKVIVAMASAILVSTACFAGGKAVTIVSTGHPDSMCLGYEDREKAEKDLGFDLKVVKEFSNGYTFKNIDIPENRELDAEGNVIGRFKNADIAYVKEDLPRVSVSIEKKRNIADDRLPNEIKQYGDVTLSYYLTHYKGVPEGYELTEEDKANLEKDDYEISVGTDEIEYYEAYLVAWEIEDLSYVLIVFDTEMTPEELFQMAQEVIDAE